MAKLNTSDDLLICCACGAQYDVTEKEGRESCRICDVHLLSRASVSSVLTRWQDPRQFVPPSGQAFTTLRKLREEGYKNLFERTKRDEQVWEIWSEPKVHCQPTQVSLFQGS